MKDVNCIFCRIASGEIPSATLYEDDLFRVILDLSPATKGHALIISKEHFANIHELPAELEMEAFALAKRMAAEMVNALECDGINIVQNNGTAAGQTVFHFHIHLIPRYESDGALLAWTPGTLSEDEKNQILKMFKK